jgi:hypothetical protein
MLALIPWAFKQVRETSQEVVIPTLHILDRMNVVLWLLTITRLEPSNVMCGHPTRIPQVPHQVINMSIKMQCTQPLFAST